MEKLTNDFKISFTKGDTYALSIKFKNISTDIRSAYFTVKENPDDEPLIQKRLGLGITKIDERAYRNEKTYKLQLQAEDTMNLEANVQYLYDLQVTIDNVVKTFLSGIFVVTHSISGASETTSSTLEVEVDNEVEVEVAVTETTHGIEYEQDPVACSKIGNLKHLTTEANTTLVGAINEINAEVTENTRDINALKDGDIVVKKSEIANRAKEADWSAEADRAKGADKATQADWAKEAESFASVTPFIRNHDSLVFDYNILADKPLKIKIDNFFMTTTTEPNLSLFYVTDLSAGLKVDEIFEYLGEICYIIDGAGISDFIVAVPAGGVCNSVFAQSIGNEVQIGTAEEEIHKHIPADDAKKVNGLDIFKDENGVLKIGDIVIPQKILLWAGEERTSYESYKLIDIENDEIILTDGDKIEIECDMEDANGNVTSGLKLQAIISSPVMYCYPIAYYKYLKFLNIAYERINKLEFSGGRWLYMSSDKEMLTATFPVTIRKIYKIIE